MRAQDYVAHVESVAPKSRLLYNCIRAFVVGGLICCVGQALHNWAQGPLGLDETSAAAFSPIVLVFLGALATGLGVYDDLGKFAGAGSIVPITGFANSMVAPAMEFRPEGWVMGTGAKLFTLAGPVLAYGTLTSMLVGLIYHIIKLVGGA